MEGRYIDLRTDFGFKRVFGSEVNKELLIGFLNALFEGQKVITDVTYLKNEQLGITPSQRHVVFDIYCQTDRGERFVVEMQNASQPHYKARSVYYASAAIREQGKKGVWDFNLDAVYSVNILNFQIKDTTNKKYIWEAKLADTETHDIFYDKLTFIYIELPKFHKKVDELDSTLDKWFYVLKNMHQLAERPASMGEEFAELFRAAELEQYSPKEQEEYVRDLEACNDMINALAGSRNEGKAEGREEGRLEKARETAREGLAMGLPVEAIVRLTGLSAEEIEAVRD